LQTFPFALQLYSVRDHMDESPANTLKAVKAAGFDHVELAGFAGSSPVEFHDLLAINQLQAVSAHLPYEAVIHDPAMLVNELKPYDLDLWVVPWIGGEAFETREAWEEAARRLEAAGAFLRQEGIRLCYHNHEHEWEHYDGVRVIDILLNQTAPEHLALELDVCWAAVGGEDVPAFIRQLGARLPMLHLKDYRPGPGAEITFAELGTGVVDFPPLLAAAQAAGVSWYIVEQDEPSEDSLESAAINGAWMNHLNEHGIE